MDRKDDESCHFLHTKGWRDPAYHVLVPAASITVPSQCSPIQDRKPPSMRLNSLQIMLLLGAEPFLTTASTTIFAVCRNHALF